MIIMVVAGLQNSSEDHAITDTSPKKIIQRCNKSNAFGVNAYDNFIKLKNRCPDGI